MRLRGGGTRRNVRVDALGNAFLEGRIVRVGGAPQEGGQRYPVVVALPAASAVRPGMLAHVQLELGQATAIRVPSRAVIREFELDYVFVIEEGDVARRVRVATRPVPFRPDRVEITSGLEAGARIAVNGVDQLRTGLGVIVR